MTAEKVLYCSSNFVRKLKQISPEDFDSDGGLSTTTTPDKLDYNTIMTQFTKSDVVLIPFFPERTQTGGYVEGQSTILVSLFPNQLKADLFERASRVSVDSRMTNSASEKRGK